MQPTRWLRPAVEMVGTFAVLAASLAPWLGGNHVTVASLVFLAATLALAARWGYAVGFVSAVLANLLVNFFFVNPLHRFAVANSDNVAALAVSFAVAAIGAFMLSRARAEAARARANEAETEALLRITREVADSRTSRLALDRLCEASARAVGARGAALFAGDGLALAAATIDELSNRPLTPDELATAREAWGRKSSVGLSSVPGLPERTFAPIQGSESPAAEPAVLRLLGPFDPRALTGSLLIGLANELRATLRRARLDEAAGRARELERSGEFKSLLLTSASHDLRTPLTAIKAAVSSLRDESVDWSSHDRAAFLETIDSQADRLSKTVTNLLAMSRLEGGAQPRTELIEVAPLLEEAALSARSPDRELTACAPAGLWVRADYGLLMQALANLIENAVKYGAPATPIRLTGSSTPGRVFLSVTNEGPPIAAEELPRLFDRFYRGERGNAGRGGDPTGRTPAEHAGGLGLALVKAIAEGAGGSVAATSDERATTFTLSLPAAAAPR